MSEKIEKSQAGTNSSQNDISPDVSHVHNWQFIKEIKIEIPSRSFDCSKFGCHCGAVKYIDQFEEED